MRAMDFAYVAPATLWSAALLGVMTGLAVALPLGAIGLLLVREGLANGMRVGAAGALAVGVVDLVYATAAVFAGGWVASVLGGRERPVQMLGAVVLLVVAVVGLVRAVRSERGELREVPSRTARWAFVRFLGLTAINPLTALTFAAITVGLGSRIASTSDRGAFAAGVFVASLAWQFVLVAIGAFLGARLPARAHVVLQVVGFAIVLGLALLLAVTALRPGA